MGRRSDHTQEEIYHLIVDTAYSIVKEEGVDELSTRRIASEVGYTPGMLYNMFMGVDDIILNVNFRILTELEEKFSQYESAKNKALWLAQMYLEFSQEETHLWSLLFEYQFSAPSLMRYRKKIQSIFKMFELAISMDYKDIKDVHEVALGVWSMVHGVCALYIRGKLAKVEPYIEPKVLIQHLLGTYFASSRLQ